MWLNLDTASIPQDWSANTDVRLREQNSARTPRARPDQHNTQFNGLTNLRCLLAIKEINSSESIVCALNENKQKNPSKM